MMKYLFVAIALVFVSIYAFAQQYQDYDDYVRVIELIWDEFSQAKELEEFQRQQDVEFQAFLREQEEAYRKYVEEVKEKWNEFIGSTEEQWVDYGEDKDVRSIVNFEEKEAPEEKLEEKPEKRPEEKPKEEKKGQITVEAIVPADAPDAVDKAKELIADQVERIFSATNEAKKNILEDQVKTRTGDTVTPQNVKKFVQEEVLPEAKVEPKPLESKDGVERVKVSVVIPMVPEHLRIRAEQYLSSVRKYCSQYTEDLPLVMAIIQTESYFNPLAKSPIPAYGLMQLVPKYGGRDAYRHIFKKDETPSPDYLYVPDNNLLLGIAYVHILQDDYFYGIRDPKKREYLTIASYNGGVGRVIKRMLRKYKVPEMSPSEVYEALRKEMPDETKDYLAKVSSRKKNYFAWR
jgi:membrane-bound lytic murein transglycosylase C